MDSRRVGAASWSVPLTRVPGCPSPPAHPPPPRCATCWRPRSPRSEVSSGTARSRWPTRSPRRSPAAQHLLVQAGTGTGKSLGYLVPALLHDERVVVATATLALQHQLVERDIPRLMEAVGELPGVDTTYAVLKGRSNYACLHRIREGVPDDQGVLVEVPTGSQGAEVLKLRAWAEEEATGDGTGERDNAPRHTDRVWRQVSVNHRECLGAAKCPFAPGVLRRAGPGEGAALAPDRHQPLAARDRRDRGRADDPRLRRRGRRRGPRARLPGHPGGHRRASRPRSSGPPVAPSGTSRASEADDLAEAADALRTRGRRPPRPLRHAARPARRGAGAGPRRRARPASRRTPRTPSDDADAGADPGQRHGPGRLRQRRADGRRRRLRRALAHRGRRAVAGPAARGAAPGVGADARQAALGQDRGLHLRHVDARRRLRAGGDSVGLKPAERVDDGRAGASATRTRCRGAGSTSARLRLRQAGDPVRRRAPAAAGPRRAGRGAARRDRGAGRRRGGPDAGAVLLAAGGRAGRRGGPRAAAAPDHAGPGRRAAARAGQAVRRRPAHLPVRHPVAVAGARRPGRHLPAGDHRPDPVPAPRRPADVARGSGPPTRPAATASCRSPRRTPRCCWPRAPAG